MSTQKKNTEDEREKGNNGAGGENYERVSGASNQADRESSPDDFEETRPKIKRIRLQEGTSVPTGYNLIGNFGHCP